MLQKDVKPILLLLVVENYVPSSRLTILQSQILNWILLLILIEEEQGAFFFSKDCNHFILVIRILHLRSSFGRLSSREITAISIPKFVILQNLRLSRISKW